MNAISKPIIEFVDLKAQHAALRDQIDARIKTVLAHTQFIMGPEVQELESRLAAFTGAKHCISVASGTEALLIALMALDIKSGDEIITTPFTFVAPAEVTVLLGAKPVFVDIDPLTYNLDPAAIEAAITARTRAIMPVSLYGQPADMQAINAVAARHGLAVIEDAAQSFGATYQGKRSCNLTTIGCTSFFPSKPLGCYGDGGALFTHDDDLARAMKEIRVHGQAGRYQHVRIGVGGRMDTLQCAVLLAKLECFEWEIEQRMRLGARYSTLLRDLALDIELPAVAADRTSVYAQYTIQVENRDGLCAALKAGRIPTAVHYPLPLHRQSAFSFLNQGPATFPHAEQAAQRVLSLPMHAYLSEADMGAVVRAIQGALSR